MKTTENNEMDLLLRALGRNAAVRSGDISSRHSDGESGAHLDADELNCFAEGVISPAERARYTTHLADCDSCRRIVADLVPATGLTRRFEVEQKIGWNWQEKLAALFAPSVLRYAVPALALTAVIAIAIVALRRQQETEFVAQNQTQPLPSAASNDEGQKVTASNGPQPAASTQSPQQQPRLAGEKQKDLSSLQKSNEAAPLAAPNPKMGTGTADGLSQSAPSNAPKSLPTFADEPKETAAPPPPAPAAADYASKAGAARAAQIEADEQKRNRDDTNYSRGREENEALRAKPTKGGPSRDNAQNVGGLTMSRQANKDEKPASNVAENRRVSGRVFQRQGNAWVDSSYAAGRATVRISRGSEQYRALIADEPGIRTIAEQLDGEVIVVWKGTAYRIR